MVYSKLKAAVALGMVVASCGLAKASTTKLQVATEGSLFNALQQAYGYAGSAVSFSGGGVVDMASLNTSAAVGTSADGTTVTFTSGSNVIRFTRISDTGANPLTNPVDLTSGLGSPDQVWTTPGAGDYRIETKVSFYSPLNLGYKSPVSGPGGAVTPIGSFTGATSALVTVPLGNPLAWTLTVPQTGNTWSSLQSDNTTDGGLDHMVTFKVSGTDLKSNTFINSAFVLAFEDLVSTSTDSDYQDLVAQFSAAGGVTGTPLPAAAWGGLSLMGALGGMGALRRRRRS